MKHAEDLIPPQEHGSVTDFSAECELPDGNSAHDRFKDAASRLLNISNWKEYAGAGSAQFTLCNNEGEPITDYPKIGDLISIELPVPSSSAGEGKEWVMIEKIDAQKGAELPEEFLIISVRPIPNPLTDNDETAHFYTDAATSNFVVKRVDRKVSAEVHGRNEVANNSGVNLHDKIRNSLVAFAAKIGLAGPQWQKLVKGLLEV